MTRGYAQLSLPMWVERDRHTQPNRRVCPCREAAHAEPEPRRIPNGAIRPIDIERAERRR